MGIHSLLHQFELVGHMHYRFLNPALITHLASYALGRSPQYMVLYISHILMHWGDNPTHWTAALLHDSALHNTTGRGACSTGQDSSQFHILVFETEWPTNADHPVNAFPHHKTRKISQHSMHACSMQIPCPAFCNVTILHVHQVQSMRICTLGAFPARFHHCPTCSPLQTP